eukprot:TRINITY_DN195_c0_g1_i2.p1 TRINITY_DN195_c0_g1~~TRINITY_DN195_c0_g1_i2.p1  ORF type:complete len:380 (+),score=46.60 TRINITY_DN195_c0_g1_i2:220-1359(+)
MLIVMYDSIKGENFTYVHDNATCSVERGVPTSIEIPSLNQSVVDVVIVNGNEPAFVGGSGAMTIEVYDTSGGSIRIDDAEPCHPVVFDVPRGPQANHQTPVCTYFNPIKLEWTDEGCTTLEHTERSTTCACTHLSTFAIEEIQYVPHINVVTRKDVESINFHIMRDNPEPLLACLCLILVGLVVINLAPDVSHIPMVASNMILPQGYTRQKLLADSDFGQEMYVLQGGSRCKTCCIWRLKIQSEHSVVSCCVRAENTNFSTWERVALFEFFAFLILALFSLFYDSEKQTGDTIILVLVTLFAMMLATCFRLVLVHSRPDCLEPQELIIQELSKLSKREDSVGGEQLYSGDEIDKTSFPCYQSLINQLSARKLNCQVFHM